MNNDDLGFIFRQMIVSFPALIVCFGGLIFSLFFLRKYFLPAILTVAAMLIFMFVIASAPAIQSYLLHARMTYGWTNLQYSQYLGAVGFVEGLARALAILLLVISVFLGRKRLEPAVVRN